MAAPASEQLGLYISIPFCRSKCTYCNFASGVYPAGEHARYIQRLIDEMRARATVERKPWRRPAVSRRHYLSWRRNTEPARAGIDRPDSSPPFARNSTSSAMPKITVECAPGQLADDTLAAFTQAGVNRISLGVQSFIDREAHQSGRLHSRAIVLNDLQRLRAAGITNLNLDLIAGLAGQTFASWQESVSALSRYERSPCQHLHARGG